MDDRLRADWRRRSAPASQEHRGARRRRGGRVPARPRRRAPRVRRRPTRHRRPSSSPPRPPGCGGCATADVIALPAGCSRCPTSPPNHLVLEWIDEGPAADGATEPLGADSPRLHRPGAPCFGREDRRTTGSRGLPNEPATTWPSSTPEPAAPAGPPRARGERARRAERDRRARPLAERLEDFAPPSRRHACTATSGPATGSSDRDGRSWLIDPAAHGGHREFDLAMMRLFGGFGAASFSAYEAPPRSPRVGRARAPDRPARRARGQVRRQLRRLGPRRY